MKPIFPILIICLFLAACNQQEVEDLKAKNEALANMADDKDSIINDMIGTFNEIEANLAEIKEREGVVEINASGDVEMGTDQSERIEKDIQYINELMFKNQELIENLNRKLQNSGNKVNEFRKLVQRLNLQLEEKELSIEKLKEQLANKNFTIEQLNYQVDTLTYENRKKDAIIEKQIKASNTAYYTFGTYQELNEKKILTKEGGFLGLGKEKKLDDDFNKEYFSKIDIYTSTSFLIYSKKAKLVTSHPSDSYEFMGEEGRVDSLVIKNPESFWSASRYLVILVD